MLRLLTIVIMGLLFSANQSLANTNITIDRQLEVHAQARVMHETRAEVDSYLIALGKHKKRKNLWLPESSQREAGTLQRLTLELPEYYSEEEAYNYYKNQLPETAMPLFECLARGCGESNNWANVHFGVKQLYGQNASQWYGVYSWPGANVDEKKNFLTLYTVRRGNGRLYTQIEILWAK